jgi:hypothetical protein
MKRFYSVFFAVILGLSFIGCENPASKNGEAPAITDVKVSSSNDILNPVFVTTLSVGQTYYFFIFASDSDLDISQCVITFKNGAQTIGPQTIPAYGQSFVSDVFMGTITPATAGTWTAEIYVVDAKGNKSNTKSVISSVVN